MNEFTENAIDQHAGNADVSFWWRLLTTPLSDLLRGRVTGPVSRRLNWRTLIAQADLPSEVAKVVHRIVRRTRLWKKERVAVAQELVAHFQDGLDEGASAEEMIALFGNPKHAAKLIRAAKRRCRPLWWQLWWCASRSMMAVVVVYFLMFLWMLPARPRVTTDYLAKINERAAAVPEEERAWPLYREALLMLGPTREGARAMPEPRPRSWSDELSYYSVDPWELLSKAQSEVDGKAEVDGMAEAGMVEDAPLSATTWAEVTTWLVEQEAFLQFIRQAAAMPRLGYKVVADTSNYSAEDAALWGYGPDDSDLQSDDTAIEKSVVFCLSSHVGPLRDLASVLQTDAAWQAQQGRADLALADLKGVLGIAHHARENPCLVSGLTTCIIRQIAACSARNLLCYDSSLWTPSQLRDLAHAFGADSKDLHYWCTSEECQFLDIVQRIYTNDGNGNGRLTGEGLVKLEQLRPVLPGYEDAFQSEIAKRTIRLFDPVLWLYMPSRQEVLAKYYEIWNPLKAEMDKPLWLQERHAGSWNRLEELDFFRYAVIYDAIPATAAVSMRFELTLGYTDGALIGIALELYRREHGDWPQSLAELTPRWLPELPIDRINGGPLGYRIVDGLPVVYSLGIDSDDDGGRLPRVCQGDIYGYYLVDSPRDNVSEGQDGDWVIWSLEPTPPVVADASE